MGGKIDSELMAAFSLSPEQLEETGELQIGYMPRIDQYEVIVRYHGDLEMILAQIPGGSGEALTERYAILLLTEEQIHAIAELKEIEYIEKPKALLESDLGALRASCIPAVQLPATYDLHGDGTLIGIMDSGIDYLHPAFITPEGESRIAALWDQTLIGEQFFTKEQITAAVRVAQEEGREAAYGIVPSRDELGHGTQVAGIAAGSGNRARGVADRAELIVVKLTENRGYGFTKTTSAMRALKYIIETAQTMGKPVAVNVSMGTNIGGHDGESLFEAYIDDWSNRWMNALVVAAGNEGAAGRHAGGVLTEGEIREIEIRVGEGRGSVMFQIWKEYADRFYINVGAPNGQNTGFIREGSGVFRTVIDQTQVLIFFGEPSPYSGASTIYVNLSAENEIASGLWRIYLQGASILNGKYDIWMTGETSGRGNTYFLVSEEETTITMPVTARSVIGVAAYNHVTGAIAPFSGRGFSRDGMIIRPDIAAPGVNVLSSTVGGGYRAVSGTSIAAPFVTGSAALLMEWGIVRRNDIFLYGERLKAVLIAGATRDFGGLTFPNRDWGYGKLCLSRTMDELASRTLMRQGEADCRDIISSEDYIELVFPRRIDGMLPFATCIREIGRDDILAYVRAPSYDELFSAYGFLSWGNIPTLYGISADETALDASGILEAQQLTASPLTGSGVVIGIVDTGIDYLHPCFRYEDGSSKIMYIWDQTDPDGETPTEFPYGREFARDEIERAIQAREAGEDPYRIVPERDEDGHGTYIAGIAAGRRDEEQGFSGAAPEAELVVVKLKQAKERLRAYYGIPQDQPAFQHTDIQQGVAYIAEKAAGKPAVILLALSSNLGPHDGSAELEKALNSYERQTGMAIVCTAGNEGDTSMHASGVLAEMEEVEFFVGEGQKTLTMTIWMKVPDQFSLSMVTPRGYVLERIPRGVEGVKRIQVPIENSLVSVEYFQGARWSGEQAALIRLENPTAGLWRLNLYGDFILNGRYDAYMTIRQWARPDTRFLRADPDSTITSPGTAEQVLTVGGYNHLTQSLYAASGRGPTRQGRIEPGIAAPAVEIYGPVSPSGYQARNGTSGAAAIAAGGCAQLLEWAIVNGSRPDISAANLRRLLYRGAKRRPEIQYPNNRWGYGELDIMGALEKS